jgi:hypothetical protein
MILHVCVVFGHGRRITFIEPQHIRASLDCASSQHQKYSSCQRGGGNKVGYTHFLGGTKF